MTLLNVELAGKRVELLKEAAPRVSRVAALVNPLHIGEEDEFRESQGAAQRLGLTLQRFPVRSVAEVNAALEAMARDHVDGVIALSNMLIMSQRDAIARFAATQRIPTISGWEDFAVAGNLMTYGPNLPQVWAARCHIRGQDPALRRRQAEPRTRSTCEPSRRGEGDHGHSACARCL